MERPNPNAEPPLPPPPAPGPYRALATPSEANQIRSLSELAARNHRSLPRTHPFRRASHDLADLLQLLLQRGVPAQELADLFTPPVSHQAIRSRAYSPRTDRTSHPSSSHPSTHTHDRDHILKFRPDAPHNTSLITSAPYRRVRLIAPPYPIPPAPLPVFYPADQFTSDQFLSWLSSPDRSPGAAYADNGLIRLHLTPVTAAEEKEPPK